MDHVTISRWVQLQAFILNQRLRRDLRNPNRSWRVDKTYVRFAGKWRYLYRAVDSAGETIDLMLSLKLDLTASKLFLRLDGCEAMHLIQKSTAFRSSGRQSVRFLTASARPRTGALNRPDGFGQRICSVTVIRSTAGRPWISRSPSERVTL